MRLGMLVQHIDPLLPRDAVKGTVCLHGVDHSVPVLSSRSAVRDAGEERLHVSVESMVRVLHRDIPSPGSEGEVTRVLDHVLPPLCRGQRTEIDRIVRIVVNNKPLRLAFIIKGVAEPRAPFTGPVPAAFSRRLSALEAEVLVAVADNVVAAVDEPGRHVARRAVLVVHAALLAFQTGRFEAGQSFGLGLQGSPLPKQACQHLWLEG